MICGIGYAAILGLIAGAARQPVLVRVTVQVVRVARAPTQAHRRAVAGSANSAATPQERVRPDALPLTSTMISTDSLCLWIVAVR
jgi:hypothetical protein